ncbi:hypothetical protein Tco_1122618 [Tanacetum coccineum]|uniref:Uncharacterized protein n=1 Tax=Tanacetum coccineum TaxID=301880 RepID=A0ABQ5J123_9ASTR
MEKEVNELKNVDHSSALLAKIKSKVLTIVNEYLGTSLDDALYKVLQKHTADLVNEHSVPTDVVEKLKQQYKPQKSVEDICKIKMEHIEKQQEPKYEIHKALYHALMELILEDEDAMDKGVADKLKKKKPDDADRDECPPDGSNQGLKRAKTSKDSAQAEEIVFEAGDTQRPQNLGDDIGNTNEPPVVNLDPKEWFKKPERPPTRDPEWNEGKIVDNKPIQKWLSDLTKAEKPSKTFHELMSTLIDFSAFVMNRLQISDLTQDILVGPAYNILKGTYRSYIELEYNMEECYRQIILVEYFFNHNLAYLQGGSTGRTYSTSLTKTKAAKYDLPRIKDMVPILQITNVKVNVWYGYVHLEEIKVQRSNQKLYRFMEGDFPRFYLNDIEDMLLLVVQKRLFNLKGEDIVHLAAALCMFTRRIVVQKRVEDLQLGVESYQKKLNISKIRIRKEDLSGRAPYTSLSDPQ